MSGTAMMQGSWSHNKSNINLYIQMNMVDGALKG